MTSSTASTYDVALSFAEEQRSIALSLHLAALECGLKSYYYPEVAQGVGSELQAVIEEVYSAQSKAAILILSKDFPEKSTAMHEAHILASRKTQEGASFHLIPILTDDCQPGDVGLPPDTIYLEWNFNPREIIGKLLELLNEPADAQAPQAKPQNNFSVKAQSIKNNISAGNVEGDLNIS